MKNKTHKAGASAWRIEVLDRLGMEYKIINGQIIYKGNLEGTLVNFLIDKRIELGINA